MREAKSHPEESSRTHPLLLFPALGSMVFNISFALKILWLKEIVVGEELELHLELRGLVVTRRKEQSRPECAARMGRAECSGFTTPCESDLPTLGQSGNSTQHSNKIFDRAPLWFVYPAVITTSRAGRWGCSPSRITWLYSEFLLYGEGTEERSGRDIIGAFGQTMWP